MMEQTLMPLIALPLQNTCLGTKYSPKYLTEKWG
jgi:hypothetical protein